MATHHENANIESAPLLSSHDAPEAVDPSLPSLLQDNLFGLTSGWIAQVGLVVFVGMIWTVNIMNPAGIFNYHPYFQSLAILGFTEGVLLLQPTNTPSSKKQGLKLHQVFQLLSLLSIIAGSTFIIYNKIAHSAAHFTTWHSKMGFITLILILLQIIIGASTIYAPSLFGGVERAKGIWKYHRMSGYLTLLSLYFTAFLATTYSDWFVQHSPVAQRAVVGVGLVVVLLSVGARVELGKLGFSSSAGEEGRVRLE